MNKLIIIKGDIKLEKNEEKNCKNIDDIPIENIINATNSILFFIIILYFLKIFKKLNLVLKSDR